MKKPSTEREYQELTRLCLLGLNDQKLAEYYGVTKQAISKWKAEDEKFHEAYMEGKLKADAEIVGKLRERATGYTYQEEKQYQDAEGNIIKKEVSTKHRPPEVGAIRTWLGNRQPDKWSEKKRLEVTGKDGKPLELGGRKQVNLDKVADKFLPAVTQLLEAVNSDKDNDLSDVEDAEVIDPDQIEKNTGK